MIELPSGDKVRPRVAETRHLIDGDEVDVAGSKATGFDVTLVARRRDVVVGVVYASRAGKLRLRLDPRLGVLSPAVHVRSVRPGQAAVFTIDAGPGYDRCAKVVAGPWPEHSLDHLRAAAFVAAYGNPPQVPSGLPSDLDEFVRWRTWHALGAVRGPKVPQQAKETVERTDFCDEPTVTIDGPDTRDIDDAVSATPVASGGWRVRVHIADVAAEVPQESELDRWALAAATSVYLPGWTTPMFPPAVSEDRCSLREGERRRVLTVTFTVTVDGSVDDVHVERGRIRSDARLTYAAVDAFLEGDRAAVPAPVTSTVAACAAAAQALGAARSARSQLAEMIVPASVEVVVVDGQVTVRATEGATASHRLIEELMVAANEAVGVWLAEHAAPVLYRRQDDPLASPLVEDLAALAAMWAAQPAVAGPGVGAGGPLPERLDSAAIAGLLDVSCPDLRRAGSQRVLAALGRAYYAAGPGGHFHLGTTHYLHFTSPIRRFADLVVHRTVSAVLDGAPLPYTAAELTALGAWVTARSGQADRAEVLVDRSLWAAVFAERAAAGRPVSGQAVVSSCHPRSLSARLARSAVPVDVVPAGGGSWQTTSGSLQASAGGVSVRVGESVRLVVRSADVLTGRASATVG